MGLTHTHIVLHTKGLTPIQRLVLAYIADYADHITCECWPSQATIATKSGLKRETVNRTIKVLESKGFLERLGHHGKSILYHLKLPKQKDSPMTSSLSTCDRRSHIPVTVDHTHVCPTITQTNNSNQEENQELSLSQSCVCKNISNTRASGGAREEQEEEISSAEDMAALKGVAADNPKWINICNTDRYIPSPTLKEVKAYAREKGYVLQGDKDGKFAKKFWYYYQSIGWLDKLGRPISRWRNLMHTWWLTEAPEMDSYVAPPTRITG